MRILVIGSGGVGDSVARIAARRDFFEAMVVADVDVSRARRTIAAAAEHDVVGGRFGAIQVDDLRNAAAALRLVAIDPAWQGGGHGRAMLEHVEQFVRELGCSTAVVYATPEAAGFYQTVGYDEEDWDAVCMAGIVQMLKKLD